MPDPAHFVVEYNPAHNQFSYLRPRADGTLRRIVINPPPVVAPPANGNTYPLRMTPVANPGDPVTLGVGHDQIRLQLSGNPMSAAAGPNSLNVLLDGKLIANELAVTSFAGEGHGQLFTLQGAWGPAPHTITLTSSLIAPGMEALWITAITYNGAPVQYSGPSPNSRPEPAYVNRTSVWDTTGMPLTFNTEFVAMPPTVPAPTLTIIKGASIDGQSAADGTLGDLLARTPTGSTLRLPLGRIIGTGPMGQITLQGDPAGGTIIDATGLPVAFGKAILVPTISGAIIEDLVLTGAAGPDNNAAAVRQQGDGIDFTMRRCEIHHCQDGVLTFAANVTFEDCYFHDNGAGDGLSHEIYINGNSDTTAVLTNVRSVCGAGATHPLKSRAGTTTVAGGSFTGSTDPTGNIGGSVIDIPDGGSVGITDTALIMGQGAAQHELLGYAKESMKNGVADVVLSRVPVTITAEAGYISSGQAAAKLTIGAGCTYAGVAPALQGWAEPVNGAFTPRAA